MKTKWTQIDYVGYTLSGYSESFNPTSPDPGVTLNVDLSIYNLITITPSGNFTLNFTNVPTGFKATQCTVVINQGATAYSVTFPSSVKWANDNIPDISAINKTHILSFITFNGGTRWYGFANINYAT